MDDLLGDYGRIRMQTNTNMTGRANGQPVANQGQPQGGQPIDKQGLPQGGQQNVDAQGVDAQNQGAPVHNLKQH